MRKIEDYTPTEGMHLQWFGTLSEQPDGRLRIENFAAVGDMHLDMVETMIRLIIGRLMDEPDEHRKGAQA